MVLFLTSHADGAVTVISASGELDLATSPQLRNLLLELLEDGRCNVVVDLSEVTVLDSVGMGVLAGGMRRVTAAGGTFKLVVTDPRIQHVLGLAGLTRPSQSSLPGQKHWVQR